VDRIPVTILTGFLGSGKTTLLNHIIKQNPNKKIAIIENEFGEISIDSELVTKSEDGIFELTNGCICCSLNGELIETLLKIVNSKHKIDHLVIETTGIADPGPVAVAFLSDYKIQSMFKLDAIVTLVDTQFIEQQMEDALEANKQIAIADVVLLNKTDKVDRYLVDAIRNIIARVNPEATLLESQFGIVEDTNLLEINGFSTESVLKTNFESTYSNIAKKRFTVDMDLMEESDEIPLVAAHVLMPHKYARIGSYSFIFPEPLDVIKFDTWCKVFLANAPFQVFRGKGILRIEDFDKRVIFQSVYNQYVTEGGEEWGYEEPLSKIVFIGRNLNYDVIAEGLKLCTVKDETDGFDEEFFEKLLSWQEKMYEEALFKGE
jgi:G3E family GTPase